MEPLTPANLRAVILASGAVLAIFQLTIVPAVAKTTECAAPTSTDVECKAELAPGDILKFDCTDAKDKTYPDNLLNVTDTKVCKAASKWTKAATTCADGDVQTMDSLKNKGVAVLAALTMLTITNAKYEGADMVLNGSCQNTTADKSAFFNVTLKSSALSSFSATVSVLVTALATGVLSAHH